MRILFAGNGGAAGSWLIRGEQMAAAVGAKFRSRVDDEALSKAQVVVLVKRPDVGTLSKLHRFNKPFVWDIVDAWPQPYGNEWDRARAVAWLRGELRRLSPFAVVFPNTRMMEDSDWTGPSLVLPHHSNPRYVQRMSAFNEQRVLAYEGAPRYLGKWDEALAHECARRGWIYTKTEDISKADYVVALRDVSGYPAPAWKSNVKTANARALGLPVIASPELSYKEFANGTEEWVTTGAELTFSLDRVAKLPHRYSPDPIPIAEVAKTYRAWLCTLGLTN